MVLEPNVLSAQLVQARQQRSDCAQPLLVPIPLYIRTIDYINTLERIVVQNYIILCRFEALPQELQESNLITKNKGKNGTWSLYRNVIFKYRKLIQAYDTS